MAVSLEPGRSLDARVPCASLWVCAAMFTSMLMGPRRVCSLKVAAHHPCFRKARIHPCTRYTPTARYTGTLCRILSGGWGFKNEGVAISALKQYVHSGARFLSLPTTDVGDQRCPDGGAGPSGHRTLYSSIPGLRPPDQRPPTPFTSQRT